jgi:cytochrome c553
MRTRMILGALAAWAMLAGPAQAAEGAADAGTNRELSAKLLVCEACHGPNGMSKAAIIPNITGQREDYILKQLHDFRSGERNVEIMKWMSESLTEPERAVAAAYFSKKGWPAKATPAAATAAPRGIAVCQACHQQNFMGAVQAEGMAAPRLAGQRYDYLVETMRAFADGERKNNATMQQLMAGVSAADREAMARYLSSL